MAMNDKFKVYAQTRATRQLAGDVARSIKVDWSKQEVTSSPEWIEREAWRVIELLLEDAERKLENMDLK